MRSSIFNQYWVGILIFVHGNSIKKNIVSVFTEKEFEESQQKIVQYFQFHAEVRF